MTKLITPFEAASLDIKVGAVTAAAGIAIGYVNPTVTNTVAVFDPRMQAAVASGVGGFPMEFLGLQTVTNGNKLRRSGVMEMANWSAALVSGAATLLPGRTYYVGNSLGQLDTTPQDWVTPLPLSATASQQVIVQPVGFALSATKLMIMPGKRRVRQYLAAGGPFTLNKLNWAHEVSALIIQSGAGGGSGRKGLGGTIRSGGGGGTPGSRFGFKYKVAELPGTGVITITNPAASAGAVSQTVDNANGVIAAFVSPAIVNFGAATAMNQSGATGGLAGNAIGGSGTPATVLPVSMPLRQPIPTNGGITSGGSSATGGVGASGGANVNGVSGAGSGGGVAPGNVPADGANSPASGVLASILFQSVAGAVGGLASGNIGGLGASWARLMGWASSGAGGAGTIIGNGGNGGAGGFPGGGGGGGAGSANGVGVFSGAGGAGANGCSLVTWEE